jgi:acetolactate synthase-1/2/3 large subunit
MTGAQALIESLRQEQVTHIFGYAGATICPAVDALKDASDIGYTLVRTEQNAGHMASGYARVSGKVGVCMVTSGPGATNLITGIATAYMDSIPMVAITGQVPSNLLGRDIFQEVDITGAVAPFSKHSYLVKNANDIPRVIKEAFHIASTGRPGPVLIDIPIDVQNQTLKKFESDGIALLDMGALQRELHRNKRFIDTTGNNVNHPNDFFIRIHAQALSALLVK